MGRLKWPGHAKWLKRTLQSKDWEKDNDNMHMSSLVI